MYDMAGNVMEWVSSLYRGYPYRADDGREDLSHFGSRVLRGGAWDQYVGDSLTTNRTGYDAITTAYSFIGFRCAFSYWEPTPTATSIPPTVTPEATPTATGVPPTLGPEPSSTPTMIPLPDQITDAHGVIMRHIPAGPFSMGSDKNDADEMPRHSLTLGEIYMDAYEVSNALYKACVKARGCSEPLNPASHTRSSYYDNAQYDNYPVIYVNWDQAKTFCEWRGTRLPSEAEWEKAAGGDLEQKTYPWGEAVIGKTLANYNRFVGDTSAVGSYPDGVSSYGLYDMAGNVWEWVADWYDRYPQNTTSNKNFGTTDRVIRGGSWYDFANSVRVSARNFYPPDRGNPNVGFRCVRSFP
jgi:serine/threonine-protein kinase